MTTTPVTLLADLFRADGRCVVMELSAQAGPGVEKAAEQTVESACHLADLAGPTDCSTVAAEDVLDAIDTLTETLGGADEEFAQALAAVTAATAQARRRCERPADRARRRGVGARSA